MRTFSSQHLFLIKSLCKFKYIFISSRVQSISSPWQDWAHAKIKPTSNERLRFKSVPRDSYIDNKLVLYWSIFVHMWHRSVTVCMKDPGFMFLSYGKLSSRLARSRHDSCSILQFLIYYAWWTQSIQSMVL